MHRLRLSPSIREPAATGYARVSVVRGKRSRAFGASPKVSIDAPSAEAFFEEQMRANRFACLPILPAHVFRAAALPLHHRDPFDRLLIAQALTEGFALVTREDFSAYGVTTSW